MRLCDESLLFAATYSTSGILYDSFEFVQSAAMLASIYQFEDDASASLLQRQQVMGPRGDMENFRCFATRMDRCVSRLTGYLCNSLVSILWGVTGDIIEPPSRYEHTPLLQHFQRHLYQESVMQPRK